MNLIYFPNNFPLFKTFIDFIQFVVKFCLRTKSKTPDLAAVCENKIDSLGKNHRQKKQKFYLCHPAEKLFFCTFDFVSHFQTVIWNGFFWLLLLL